MKQFIKLFIIVFVFIISSNMSFGAHLSSIVSSSPLDKTSTVSISVKEVNTGKSVFEYNEKKR